MTFKDKVALLISVLALLLSGLGFYFSQLRTSSKLEAVVLESDPLGGDASIQIAILNQGTHRVIINRALLHQDTNDGVLKAMNPFEQITMNPELPASLEAKDVLLLRFKGPLLLSSLYERGAAPDVGSGLEIFNGEPTRKISVSVDIHAIDFRGESQVANLSLFTSHITQTSVAGINSIDNDKTFFEHECDRPQNRCK